MANEESEGNFELKTWLCKGCKYAKSTGGGKYCEIHKTYVAESGGCVMEFIDGVQQTPK